MNVVKNKQNLPSVSSSFASSAGMGVRWSAVPGQLDPQLPSVQERAVHGVHGVFGVASVVKPNEGEAPALFGVAVSGYVDVPDPAVLLEDPSEGFGRSSVR